MTSAQNANQAHLFAENIVLIILFWALNHWAAIHKIYTIETFLCFVLVLYRLGFIFPFVKGCSSVVETMLCKSTVPGSNLGPLVKGSQIEDIVKDVA